MPKDFFKSYLKTEWVKKIFTHVDYLRENGMNYADIRGKIESKFGLHPVFSEYLLKAYIKGYKPNPVNKFTKDQIEIIEDRVVNLIQPVYVNLDLIAMGMKEFSHKEIELMKDQIMKLVSWVRNLRK